MRKTIKTSSKLVSLSKISISEKHYAVALFLATSVIGMLILIYGAYNASRDFEMQYKINTLYSILESRFPNESITADKIKSTADFSNDSYSIAVLGESNLISNDVQGFSVSQDMFDNSRVNERGGFVTLNNNLLVWVMLPRQNDNIVLLHHDHYVDITNLFRVYARHLSVPTVFYIWLMIWATLIIHFLTKKLHTQKNQMEHMALYDGLTDLPNRHLFNDRLDKLITDHHRQPVSFSLAIIDLNNFKRINDTLGHCYGDALLSTIAKRLKDSVRQSDTVARLGGDEFAVLLSQVDKEDSFDMCQRIHEKIVKPMVLNGKEIGVGASIGIASFPEHGMDAETLIHKADQSMYKIKACGGGTLVYKMMDEFKPGRRLHTV